MRIFEVGRILLLFNGRYFWSSKSRVSNVTSGYIQSIYESAREQKLKAFSQPLLNSVVYHSDVQRPSEGNRIPTRFRTKSATKTKG